MSLFAAVEPMIIVVVVVMMGLFTLISLLFISTFMPWLQAFTAGAPVSIVSIIGMRFRKIPASKVLRFRIMAKQAGVDISCNELEQAYLQGVDLEKVTLAMIHANREGMPFTFQELVEADLESKLDEKLGM